MVALTEAQPEQTEKPKVGNKDSSNVTNDLLLRLNIIRNGVYSYIYTYRVFGN